jgi:hypothetical protein
VCKKVVVNSFVSREEWCSAAPLTCTCTRCCMVSWRLLV